MDSISITLHKSKPRSSSGFALTAATFKSADVISEIVNFDEGYRVLKSVHDSPAYWQTMPFDMLSKVKQLGPVTWFLTLSVADMQWNELIRVVCDFYGETKSDEDIVEIPWTDWCHYIMRNPVLIASHIDYMFHQLFHRVIKSSPHPVAQVLDYEVKKEFQARGYVHFHMVIWVESAPKLDVDDDSEVITFIDNYVSSHIPDNNKPLANLVTKLRTHHHTHACKQCGACRFSFPQVPSPQTLMSCKPESPELLNNHKTAREILTKVYNKPLEYDDAQPITTETLLASLGITVDQYISCMEIASTKTTVILKCTPEERFTNNYNAFLLEHWQAYMDIQLVIDPYACTMYTALYLCKADPGISELLRKAARKLVDTAKLRLLGNTFMNHRKLSVQEAVKCPY